MGAAAVGVTTTPLRQPLTNEEAVFTDNEDASVISLFVSQSANNLI